MMRRRPVKVVIGIPTVARSPDYLMTTLRSVIGSTVDEDRRVHRVVVMNAESPPEEHLGITRAVEAFRFELESGFLTIMEKAARLPDDGGEYAGEAYDREARQVLRWRAKQVLDFVNLIEACQDLGDLYLHLEDDIVAADNFLGRLLAWSCDHFLDRDDWTMLSFYSAYDFTDKSEYPLEAFFGAIGMMFRCKDLSALAQYLRERFDQQPVDYLVRDFIRDRQGAIFAHTPSLFQHIGLKSSKKDHCQAFFSPTFEETHKAPGAGGGIRMSYRLKKDSG